MADYRNNRRPTGSSPTRQSAGNAAGNRNRSGSAPRTRSRQAQQARRAAARRKKRNRLFVRLIAILLAAVIVVVGVIVLANNGSRSGGKETASQEVTQETAAEGEENTEAVKSTELTLIAAGDVIGHDTILELARADDGYDFRSLFAPLKSDISAADIAVVNMETPFGGEEAGPYIGYPSFNTPDQMGLALIDAGFDVVQLASNHTMDSGTVGLLHELDFWKKHKDEITTIGLYDSEETKNEITILEKDGVKIAFLNYTYGLNGYELPEEYSYMLTLLTDENREFIKSQIEEADKEADIVVVCPHWGTEYQLKTPDSFQQSWAELFTKAGADVIIGTHPHVVEKADWIEAGGNKALCYYSLGNYVSNQQDTETVLGVLAYVKIKSDENGVYVEEDSAKVIPVVTQNDKTGDPVKISTGYLADYTDDMAAVHDTKLSFDPEFSVEKLEGIIEEVFGEAWVRDRMG